MKVWVNLEDKRWKKYKIDFEKIVSAVVGRTHKKSEVSITLTNDKEIRKINKKYRGIDRATNVLSFELGDDLLMGDIFISLDTVMAEAKSENIPVPEHVAHMVVHGMLHLMGYDHIKNKEAIVMESREIQILEKLGYKNPYADDVPMCQDASCCIGSRTIGALRRFFASAFGRTILYMLCGALASLGFAPFYMWWATVVGICGAYLLSVKYLPGHSFLGKFVRVFPFSAFYAMAMFWWVLHSIYVVPELANQFAIWTVPGLIGIGIVGGIFFAIPFLAISGQRTNPAVRPFLFAAVWAVVLWAREWIFTGFPWNPISNIAIENIYVANSMAMYGAIGLSFVIVGLIASLGEIIRNHRNGLNWVALFSFIMVGLMGIGYGIKNINSAQDSVSQSPLIRIVQPAQSATQKASYSRQAMMQNAKHNIRAMAMLAMEAGDYDLVVFPETAYPFVMMPGDIMSLASAIGKPVIIGSNYYSDGKLYNSMLLANANGVVSDVYSKSHLVPFGEYRPFGDIIPTPGQLAAGDGPVSLKIESENGGKFVFAPAICYEIIFSDSLLRRGDMVDAIINITNDNWFGKTPGTYQHLDMVRRYAIESGLPIVRANYSGISAFVASDGRIIAGLPIGQAGVLDGMVYGAHETLYRLLGRDAWIIIVLMFACLGAMWMSQVYKSDD